MSNASATNASGQWTPGPAPAEVKAALEEDAPAGLSATAPEFRPAGQGRRKSRKSRTRKSRTKKSKKSKSRRHRKGGASCSGM